MKNILTRIRQSLSLKLSVIILVCVTVVFVLSLGFQSIHSRHIIREEAIDRGERVLEVTSQRIKGVMEEAQVVTRNMEWMVKANVQPDSLLEYTNRLLKLYPKLNGCSITMEPGTFPELGDFSAYSVREDDLVKTEREGHYDYYSKSWYASPVSQGHPCWVEPYDDYNDNTLYTRELIISYCLPVRADDADSTLMGVIATDLSFKTLAQIVAAEKPYPHSYSIMLGKEGHFFIHPDSTKLFNQMTIFTDVDPATESDVITLGHEMISGKKGNMRVNFGGEPCQVYYQPVEGTGWSLALVVPESDILYNHSRMGFIVIPLIIGGLLLILLLCRRVVSRFVVPLNQLAKQTRYVAEGHFDEFMNPSKRTDVLGQLQNSFVHMQQSVAQHVGQLHQVNDETIISNEKLALANRKAREVNDEKTAFIGNLTNQVRTPLNVIMGFAQVLRDNQGQLAEGEVTEMLGVMRENSQKAAHLIDTMMLTSILSEDATLSTNDRVLCNEMARRSFNEVGQRNVHTVALYFQTSVPDDLAIQTNADSLHRVLVELLSNALRFTAEGSITLKVSHTNSNVNFIVEDTGSGIPKAEHEHIFTQFMKLSEYGEGLGLGLSISKRLAELMGGNLIHDISYINGARFILQLPRTDNVQKDN